VPPVQLAFYRDRQGRVPVLEWLDRLQVHDRRGYAKCLARLAMLRMTGFALRRPIADYLRDGVYELRARSGNEQLRILHCFYRSRAVLMHALTKEDAVPDDDIERAVTRRNLLERDPDTHIAEDLP